MNDQKSPASSATENRRGSTRYVGQCHQAEIEFGDRTIQARLLNQSLGGIAVETDMIHDLSFGREVSVALDEEQSTGFVRAIRKEDDGTYRLSISWNDYVWSPDKQRRSVAHFLTYRHVLFVCELLFDDGRGSQKTVRLWDGAEFCVSPDELCSHSIETRRSDLLKQVSELPVVARLYGLATDKTEDELIEDILDFEFSIDSSDSKNAPPSS